MMAEEVNESFDFAEHFLTAEALVSLRKSDDPIRNVVGEKFSNRNNSSVEEEAVRTSLANLKESLSRKRATRICDLMQAEWDEQENVAFTTKLKGKYVHHMGRSMNGKIALSPEESMFLLENGTIEIMNGAVPMSTEEGLNVMLKGNLAFEKYRVYSHLSQLGFIVVSHQAELSVASCEGKLNLDKHHVKKRKLSGAQEPDKKRLTFSGALSSEPKQGTSHYDLEGEECSSNGVIAEPETLVINGAHEDVASDVNIVSDSEEATASKCLPDKKFASETTVVSRNYETGEETREVVVASSAGEDLSVNEDCRSGDVTLDRGDESQANDSTEALASDCEVTFKSDSRDPLSDNDVAATSNSCDVASRNDPEVRTENNCDQSRNVPEEASGSGVALDDRGDVLEEMIIVSDADNEVEADTKVDEVLEQSDANDSLSVCEFQSESVGQQVIIDSQSNTEISAKNDVMDVASHSSETCGATLGSNSPIVVSPGSSRALDCDVVQVDNDDSSNASNSEVMSCSSSNSQQSDALSLDAGSQSSILSRSDIEDDEVTLIEVTKTQKTPLAVIDLLSDEESPPEHPGGKEDVSILKTCSRPSCSSSTPFHSADPRKLNGCKKEENGSHSRNSRTRPALTVVYPDMSKKELVCVVPPPLALLPARMRPSKETYVLDFVRGRQSAPEHSMPGSFRPLITFYNRRHNRHMYPPFTGEEHSALWTKDVNRTYPPDQAMPNRSFVNSVVSIRHQNAGMVGNSGFPAMPQGFPPDVPVPNFAQMPPNQIISEVQRTAFSMARSMLSQMLHHRQNDFSHIHNSGLLNSYSAASSSFQNGFPDATLNHDRTAFRQRQRHTGRPFPCQFPGAGKKRSWDEVRSSSSRTHEREQEDDNDVELLPLTEKEVLWGAGEVHPLVKPGVRHHKSFVINCLSKNQKANLRECSLTGMYFERANSLQVAFDVYLPGSNYSKTRPTIPKQRIIVLRSTDPIPKLSEIAHVLHKWNDGASLLIANVNNGDVSFTFCDTVSLPSIVPHGPS